MLKERERKKEQQRLFFKQQKIWFDAFAACKAHIHTSLILYCYCVIFFLPLKSNEIQWNEMLGNSKQTRKKKKNWQTQKTHKI